MKSISERNLLLHAWGAKQQLCEQVLFLLLLRLVRPSVSQVTSYHAHDPNSSSCNTQQQQHQQRQQQQQQQTLNKSTVEIPISLPHHNLYADVTKIRPN